MRRVAGLFLCAAAFAQSFEVASIRQRELPLHLIAGFSSSGPRVVYEAWPILLLVMEAYDLKRHQVAFPSRPPDADTAYYDIAAKAEGAAPRPRSEFRPMLQALLAERFRLKVHWEDREMPVYALIVGKGGPKLKESAADTSTFLGGVNGRNQYIQAKKMTMDDLARNLDFLGVDRPVIDRTGLAGRYDIRLEATPSLRRDSEPGELSIFTAVQEQLGLKLEPQRAKVEVLVVDHVEKPSAN